MKQQAKTIKIHHLCTERPHSVTSPTERWRTCGLVTQLILSPLAKWPHLPSNQWEEQNSQRPPISCVVVRSPAQNLWGCTAEGARACMHEMHRIYMHWCPERQNEFAGVKESWINSHPYTGWCHRWWTLCLLSPSDGTNQSQPDAGGLEQTICDSAYWCSSYWYLALKHPHHNLISLNKPVGSVAIDALVALTSAGRQLCRIRVSSGRFSVSPPLCTWAVLLSAGDVLSLTVVCQKDILHLQRKVAKCMISGAWVVLHEFNSTAVDVLQLLHLDYVVFKRCRKQICSLIIIESRCYDLPHLLPLHLGGWCQSHAGSLSWRNPEKNKTQNC